VQAIQALLPTLETERLRLRAPEVEDFAAYAEIACSDRGTFIARPQTREAAWYDFASMVAGWILHGRGIWTIEHKDQEVLGFVLIGFEPGDEDPELGYMLRDSAEGKGIAFEASVAVRDHACATLDLPQLVSYVDPANHRSTALAKRLGGRPDGTLSYPGEPDSVVYRYAATAKADTGSGGASA